MTIPEIESVGQSFSEDLILRARNQTLAVIELAAQRIRPGMTEDEGRALIQGLLKGRQCEKSWHAPQVRFGVNTLCAFAEPGVPNLALGEQDVYFLDLGPVFGRHEGDVGRSYAVGDDPERARICADAEAIWHEVRDHWAITHATGAELYSFAAGKARARGWILTLHEADGHRIADFPHAAKQRGTVGGLDFKPAPNKWILEIQIRHPTREFGAFHEDLLA